MMHVVFELAVNTIVRVIILISDLCVLSANKAFSVFIVKSRVMGKTERRGLKKSGSASVFPEEVPIYM